MTSDNGHLRDYFSGAQAEADFALFARDLREQLKGVIARVLASEDDETLRHIQSALDGSGKAAFIYHYEDTLPLRKSALPHTFHEALVSLRGNKGEHIGAGDVMAAVNRAVPYEFLGGQFRLWLICDQILDFYTQFPAKARLSVNILPEDTDRPAFRMFMQEIMNHTQACGYANGLVLEAVETAPWNDVRADFLKKLSVLGPAIVIDDYGAAGGFNQEECIATFNNGSLAKAPVIKLDGGLVRDFLDRDDTRLVDKLRAAKAASPASPILAEWLLDVEDVKRLEQKLAPYGLSGVIDLVQGRDLTISRPDFLAAFGDPILPASKPL